MPLLRTELKAYLWGIETDFQRGRYKRER